MLGVLLPIWLSCGTLDAAPASRGPDGDWVVSQFDGHAAPSRPLAHVNFRDGLVSASNGCNEGTGSYTSNGGGNIHISFIPFTLRACGGQPADLQAFEGDLFQMTSFERLPGGLLLMRGSNGGWLLLRHAPPPPQLLEGDWVINAAYPVMRITAQSYRSKWVTFHDGVVRDSAGCVGRYSGRGEKFRVSLSKTPQCAAPAGLDPRVAVGLTEDTGPAFLSRLRIVGLRFKGEGDIPELVDASGALIDLSPAPGELSRDWNDAASTRLESPITPPLSPPLEVNLKGSSE